METEYITRKSKVEMWLNNQPIVPGKVQHQPLPKSVRTGSRKSYGPYMKSYASSVCSESEIPEEYHPYSDEVYSEEFSEKLPEAVPSGSNTEYDDEEASEYPYSEDDNGIELDFFGTDRKTTQCLMSWKRNDEAYLTPNNQEMRYLTLIDNAQEVGEFNLKNDGNPKMVDMDDGIYSIQKFKIFIPLITRQVYEMIGFNGEIPSVSIQTEAFPLLKMPDGMNSSIIEPQTTQVRTKTSFDISPDGKSLMIIETSLILTARLTVTNVINVNTIEFAPIGESTGAIPQSKQNTENTFQRYEEYFSKNGINQTDLMSLASSVELGNLEDYTDIETECEAETDSERSIISHDSVSGRISSARLPFKAKDHNKSRGDADVSEESIVEGEDEGDITDVEENISILNSNREHLERMVSLRKSIRSNASSRMSRRANDSAYDSAFTDSEAGTLSDIMSDFDLAASINGAVSLNGIDELRELKDGFSDVSLFDSGLDEIDFNSAKAF